MCGTDKDNVNHSILLSQSFEAGVLRKPRRLNSFCVDQLGGTLVEVIKVVIIK